LKALHIIFVFKQKTAYAIYVRDWSSDSCSAALSGETTLNSISDIGAMRPGFGLASRAPTWASVATAAAFELFVGAMIRDNLALNIIMLLYPIDAIKRWQGGG
jgi:hypothetical protein